MNVLFLMVTVHLNVLMMYLDITVNVMLATYWQIMEELVEVLVNLFSLSLFKFTNALIVFALN